MPTDKKVISLDQLKMLAQRIKSDYDKLNELISAIEIPTDVSDLNNDLKFQTQTEVASSIAEAIAGVDSMSLKIVDSVESMYDTRNGATSINLSEHRGLAPKLSKPSVVADGLLLMSHLTLCNTKPLYSSDHAGIIPRQIVSRLVATDGSLLFALMIILWQKQDYLPRAEKRSAVSGCSMPWSTTEGLAFPQTD